MVGIVALKDRINPAGGSVAPNIGRLKSITSTPAISLYSSYDTLGRATSMSQTIAGYPDTFTFANTYYLNDALKTQTHPSGRSVKYTLDDAGRVEDVSDGTTTYADMSATAGHAYAPDGRLRQMMLGNGLWETRDYQTPGMTTRFKLGTSAGAGERLELGYDYHATQNNGNLMSHTITRSGTTWTQTFGYDGVNRLKTATETNGYNREFGYDAFGNRWLKSNTGRTLGDSHEPQSNVFAAATNRMTTSTVAYDAAGNQTLYSPHTLAYDAENRLFSMTHASSGSGTYLYDGQGRRVKKTWTAGGGTAQDTYYVYDIAGNLAAEYGTASNPDAATPPPPATLYPFTDMLGSVRAVTNAAGTVVECYDYLPFGRMLSSSDNGRSTLGCHPSPSDTEIDSDVSQKFTGQVRDEETRLDYFNARYMSAPQGRFLSPDPLLISARLEDPQTWNRYVYGRNNPLKYTDPSGLFASPAYRCTDEETACLSDEQRRILEASTIEVDEVQLSGEALYGALSEARQNVFVNVTDRLAAITVSDGTTALNQVSSLIGIDDDRVFANVVNGQLAESLGGSNGFKTVPGHEGYNHVSYKDTGVMFGNIQLSFDKHLTGVDIDMDIGNIAARNPFKWFIGAVTHAGEYISNKVFNTSTNQNHIRRLLMGRPSIQTLTPSRDPRFNRP